MNVSNVDKDDCVRLSNKILTSIGRRRRGRSLLRLVPHPLSSTTSSLSNNPQTILTHEIASFLSTIFAREAAPSNVPALDTLERKMGQVDSRFESLAQFDSH